MAVILDYIDRQLSTPKKEEVGIGGFTALVRVSESYNLSADVPSTPVESGAIVNDHIIRKPLTLSISGDVSDLYKKPSETIRQFQKSQAEIGNVTSQYAPSRTQAQLSKANSLANDAVDALRRIDNLIDTGNQAADLFGNRDSDTKGGQEAFLDAMESYYFSGTPLSVDMPYRRHDMMVITSLTSSYDNKTNSTTFSIDLQKIVLAELEFAELTKPSIGTGGQLDKESKKGAQAGKKVESSFIFEVFN